MEDLIIILVSVVIICLVLAIGGAIADYIFPRCEAISKFIDSLPMMNSEDEQL